MAILVTGCAGYIGSICSKLLLEAGFEVTGLDNLSTNEKLRVPNGVQFYSGCISNDSLVREIHQKHNIDCVMHFAAFIQVAESVAKPSLYEENNLKNTERFVENLIQLGIKKLIFSSSAAVYGIPENISADGMLDEETEYAPINPYGQFKLDVERFLEKISSKNPDFKYIALRYFNVAGAYGNYGECHEPETHVIPLALDAALGYRDKFFLYGNDYPTPDGFAVRDYVHVVDLANAHIDAMKVFEAKSGFNTAYNLGYGKGTSVLEIVEAIEKISGKKVPYTIDERRAGDPPSLVAKVDKAIQAGFYKPQLNSLEKIIQDALAHRIKYQQAKHGVKEPV